MNQLKSVLEDRTKFFDTLSFVVLAVLAFFVLIKNDFGNCTWLNRITRETKENIADLEHVKGLKAQIDNFNLNRVEKKSTNQLMELITNLAVQENITFSSMKPLETKSIAGYKIKRVEGGGTASYADIVKLLMNIEAHDKFIFVELLSLLPATNLSSHYDVYKQAQKEKAISFTMTVSSVGT